MYKLGMIRYNKLMLKKSEQKENDSLFGGGKMKGNKGSKVWLGFKISLMCDYILTLIRVALYEK